MAFGVPDTEDVNDVDQDPPEIFDLGDKDLELTDNERIYDSFFTQDKDFQYRSDKLLIGEKVNGNGYYWLDVREAFRMIFLAPTRSGKSFAIQRIASVGYKSGYDLAVLPDAKNEFHTMEDPIQEKFRDKKSGASENTAYIHPDEEPAGLNIQTYRPSFFQSVDSSMPENNKYCSVDLDDIEWVDFKTLIGFDDMTSTQQDWMDTVYHEAMNKNIMNIGGDGNNESGIIELMDEFEELKDSTKNRLVQKLNNLKDKNFFESQYIHDPVEDIKRGRIPVLNMQKFDSFSRSGTGMPQSMISIWLRNIINARRDGDIDETIIINDETPRWIPASGNPSCKQEFMESVDLDTAEGINYIFAAQRPRSVPDDLITQCRYIAVPWRLDTDDLKHILKKTGIAKNVQTAHNTASRIKEGMSRFEWLIIDQDRQKHTKIKFMAPLSFHDETNN